MLQSNHQENCSWNTLNNTYENCNTINNSFQITIDQTANRIFIEQENQIDIYKITSKEISVNQTTFHTIHATGIGKTIVFNTNENRLTVTDETPQMRTQFFINE